MAWAGAWAGSGTRQRHAALCGRGPNDLWRADFKDEFKLGDGRYCYRHRKKSNISTVLAGQSLGIKEADDGIWARQLHSL